MCNVLILGALLHDIGKVIQRDIGKAEGTHSDIGYDFLTALNKDLALFAKYHHEKDMKNIPSNLNEKIKNLLWIVCEADSLSSKERGQIIGEFNPQNPLISTFSKIKGIKKYGEDSKERAYPLTTFDFNNFVYPAFEKDKAEDRINHRSYEIIAENFKHNFPLLLPDLILTFLEKEATFIPARTGEDEDISLFDHLKTTSAIASCIYLYHKESLDKNLESNIKKSDEKKYLLISGDISGIQKFIYNITSKGSLKLLRARSFLLEIISEDFVQELLEELNLSRANLLYSAGGHFYIIAPNKENVKMKIYELKKKINDWLLEKFEGDIYYAINFIEFKGEDFDNFSKKWDDISRKLEEEKLRKFSDLLIENPEKLLCEKDFQNKKEKCEACKKYVKNVKSPEKEEIKYCDLCYKLLDFGRKLSYRENRYILRFKEIENYDLELPFSKIKITDNIKDSNFNTVFQLNSFEIPKEIFGLKKEIKFTFVPLPLGNYVYEGELEKLAEESVGLKKVGVLRMDVDNLGKIFREGLLTEKRTISRITNLSRFLNHFFKGYLNLLGEFKEYSVKKIAQKNWEVNGKIIRLNKRDLRKFVIVYAGGDDLLIIGSWDDVFELAFDINSLFRMYVGENDNITLSAGFCIFDVKFHFIKCQKYVVKKKEKQRMMEKIEFGYLKEELNLKKIKNLKSL